MTEQTIDEQRRKFLSRTGAALATSLVGSNALGLSNTPDAGATNTHTVFSGSELNRQHAETIRWGFVGTGSIANRMAVAIQGADNAELVAVSSRQMESANAFAQKYEVSRAFDSWQEMASWEGVDAIYLATPTSVKEEIAIFAANKGKHVLIEKPFASLASLEKITEVCRKNGLGLMDGTHFSHSPRTAEIQNTIEEKTGRPWSLSSAFHFGLRNKNNIRFNTSLEPQGAVGDAGWYCMRAAVEYLPADIELLSASTYLRRDNETGAVTSASGVLHFDDGASSTWNCGFETGAMLMDLRIVGSKGVLKLDDFIFGNVKSSSYKLFKGGLGAGTTFTTQIAKAGDSLQFQNYASMVQDPVKIEQSIKRSHRTQQFLDAAWQSGLENELKVRAGQPA